MANFRSFPALYSGRRNAPLTFLLMLTGWYMSGCAAARHDPRWQAQELPPAPLPSDMVPYAASKSDSLANSGYALHLVVHAVDIDMSTLPSFVQTSRSQPGGSKFSPTSGHSWVVLESPDKMFVRGHTGNSGYTHRSMSRMFLELQQTDEPNPIYVLWERRTDGRAHERPGNHRVTFALRVPISPDQHARVKRVLKYYDYRHFSVATNQCTDLVAKAAQAIGLPLKYRLRLTFPPTAQVYGRELRVWTDPTYQTIEMGNPDVLHRCMRDLHRKGIGTDSTHAINAYLKTLPIKRTRWSPTD